MSPEELLLGIFGRQPSGPRRSDFDVPMPADTKAWLARITAEHKARQEGDA